MSQVSVSVRVFALISMLAALAAGAWVVTAGRNGTPSSNAQSVAPLSEVHRAQSVAGALTAHNRATAAGREATSAPAPRVTAHALTAAAAPTKQAASAPALPKATVVEKSSVPHTIAGQLKAHSVVVVLLYDPKAKVDSFSVAEAALGAKAANAGFLRVDVLQQHQAMPFTKAYGVLQDPTLLFFTRPGQLAFKLAGFADHDTVAQAAKNAALGLGTISES